MKTLYHIVFFLGLFLSSAMCQSSEVDSLINSYDPNVGTDYERVVHLRSIVWLTNHKDEEKANKYFKMCEEIASQSKDSNTIMEVLFIGSARDRNAKEYVKAKEKTLKVLDYSQRHKDTANVKRLHYHIGDIYFKLEEYENAIFHSLRARDNTPSTSFRMHYNLTHRLTKIYDRIGMQEKVLDEWKWYNANHDITLKRLKSLALGRISEEYIKRNNPDSALVYADLSLKSAQLDNLVSREYRAMGLQAHANLLNGNIEDAILKGKKAYDFYDVSKEKSHFLAFVTARKALGGAYKEQGKYNKASKIFKEGLNSAMLNNNISDQQYFLEHLLEIAIMQKRSQEALDYSKALYVVKEKLKNQYRDQNILKIKTEYDVEKKDLEIKLLNSQNMLKDAEIGRSKRNTLFAFIGLALLGIISFLLYNSLKNKKKSQLELLKKNVQISEALADKELLLKEIHHRVKNNLQVVSSLLGLQSEYIKDASALSAINEGRNRVRSMSLIHQNLYKEHNLKGIGMKSYLDNLISGLFDTYNINKEKIKLSLTIQDIDLDVDTVVPIGLITNELVSNALKHAFKIKKEGIISVSLQENEEVLELIVSDNGDGLDSTKINEDIESFGYQMIFAFKNKLNADLDINNVHGTSVKLSILEYQKT